MTTARRSTRWRSARSSSTSLGLDRYGLSWRLPEIDCVHPLDGGSAGVLYRSVEATADGLGADRSRWRRLFGWTSARFDALVRGHHGPAAAGAAPSADAGPVRRADRAARVGTRQVVSHRRGPRVVRRCCGTCLSAAALPDDVGDRARDHHRRASPRVGGRGRLDRNRSPTRWQRCWSIWAARSKPGPVSRRRRSSRRPT